jgi:hypothetical protein
MYAYSEVFHFNALDIFDVAHLARKSENITAYFNSEESAKNALAALKNTDFSSNELFAAVDLQPGQCLLCWDADANRNRSCWWCIGEATRAEKNNGRGYISVLSARKPCSICSKFDHKAKSCPQNMSTRAKRKRRLLAAVEKKKTLNVAERKNRAVASVWFVGNNTRPERIQGSGKRAKPSASNYASGFRTVQQGGPVFSAVI